jgi:hypothetical protein
MGLAPSLRPGPKPRQCFAMGPCCFLTVSEEVEAGSPLDLQLILEERFGFLVGIAVELHKLAGEVVVRKLLRCVCR